MSILPKLGEQLAGLAVEVLGVLAHVAVLLLLAEGDVIAHGVQAVDGEVGVVPVDEGVVEADLEALGAEGLDQGAEQVAPGGGVGGLVVGEGGVPEAEALVVLGGDDEVLHAGVAGLLGPDARVVEVGVEVVEVLLVVFVADVLLVAHPLVAGGERVEAPVDEQAEAVVEEPF